jgi:hypothetical protein
MKRTKQWWAGLTKEERSELHRLDYANSSWLNRLSKKHRECSHCSGFRGYEWDWLCPKCTNRRNQLIKKANEATLCNPR